MDICTLNKILSKHASLPPSQTDSYNEEDYTDSLLANLFDFADELGEFPSIDLQCQEVITCLNEIGSIYRITYDKCDESCLFNVFKETQSTIQIVMYLIIGLQNLYRKWSVHKTFPEDKLDVIEGAIWAISNALYYVHMREEYEIWEYLYHEINNCVQNDRLECRNMIIKFFPKEKEKLWAE